ncbi:hypothetical protein GCM10009844_42860 [Nocardioides koreensis]|uniref:Lipoprotein n=1 Tax=Nocardioides koreensis TaxID=433651 RepID=A0ABN3A7F3_9ACTN
MKTGILAATLTLTLATLGACSSAGGDEPTATKASPSASGAASPSGSASPAVRMREDGGQWTNCVPYQRSEGDFLWTGVRLTADADARLVRVAPAQANGVRVVGAWVAEAEHASGAFVPWSKSHEFLRKMDWADRADADGAQLSAGTKYSMVFRLRPMPSRFPAELTDLTIEWEGDGSSGSLTNDTVLQFKRHC